jgi:Plasmid replication protein
MKKTKSKPKSLRTAFIRVTSVNETQTGIVLYNLGDIENKLSGWSTSTGMTYWFIKHNPDLETYSGEEDYENKEHFHIVIKFKNPMPFESIKKRFPYGNIQSARNVKDAVQYLVHANDKTKEQYSWDSIISNSENPDLYKFDEDAKTLEWVFEEIDAGRIREYNQFTEIPPEIWRNNRQKIENALLYFRERICMDKHRNIVVRFVGGSTGFGKTTLAKRYCEGKNMSYCISSSSNDALQDYKGEQVLILDDLRDDSFSFHDLLKILDNHTKSSARSRYHNKAFIGETIIITSSVPLKDWYKDISAEDRRQLFRRIKCVYEMEDDWIYSKEYNEETSDYDYTAKIPNFIRIEYQRRRTESTELFDGLGYAVQHVNNEDIVKTKGGLEQTKLF